MSERPNAGPSWLELLLKLALGIAWLAAAGIASGVLMGETSRAAEVAAALFLIVPPVGWCVAALLWARRLDEMHQRVAFLGLANDMRFAIMWVGLMIGGSVLSSLYLGDGEATAFGQLRAYAKRE